MPAGYPVAQAASPQQISAAVLSFIIATSSAGACLKYSGTTMSPSAMAARSIAIQRMLLAASSPNRSPLLSLFETRKVRAF